MFEVELPGRGRLALTHLVLDYNGTIARDGSLLSEAAELIEVLSKNLTVHVLTADTGGLCRQNLSDLPVTIHILQGKPEDEVKLAYVRQLGPERCAAVGNGRNDVLMLEEAALGVAVIGDEGASPEAVNAADVVVPGISQALELFIEPLRLIATIRN